MPVSKLKGNINIKIFEIGQVSHLFSSKITPPYYPTLSNECCQRHIFSFVKLLPSSVWDGQQGGRGEGPVQKSKNFLHSFFFCFILSACWSPAAGGDKIFWRHTWMLRCPSFFVFTKNDNLMKIIQSTLVEELGCSCKKQVGYI